MEHEIVAKPAYGVIINSQKALKEHIESGKDLQDLLTGQYFSQREIEQYKLRGTVRYGKDLTKVIAFGYGN